METKQKIKPEGSPLVRLFLLSSTLVTFVAIGFMWFSVASEGMLSMIRDLPEYVMSGRGPWGHSTAVRGAGNCVLLACATMAIAGVLRCVYASSKLQRVTGTATVAVSLLLLGFHYILIMR
jgi:hypothetical protein